MVSLILLIAAFVAFVFAACNVPAPPRLQLVPLGLALWVLSVLLAGKV